MGKRTAFASLCCYQYNNRALLLRPARPLSPTIACWCASGWGTQPGGSSPSGAHAAAQQRQRRAAAARGPFPAGCKWRAVGYQGAKAELWDVPEYEYWDEPHQRWGPRQPTACTVRGEAKTDTWVLLAASQDVIGLT